MHEIEKIIILDEDNPISKNLIKTNGKLSIELNSELDNYIYQCSRALSALTDSVKKSRLSLSLISYEHIKQVSFEEFSKSTYIEVIVENSIIRVQSVFDRVLIFVNKILALGISNDQISYGSIISNDWVIRFDLVRTIKSINKQCNDYRYVRNKVIHHDRYSEKELDELTLFIETNDLILENGGNQLVPDELIAEKSHDYFNFKQSELTSYMDDIEKKMFSLYEFLIKIYLHKKLNLK